MTRTNVIGAKTKELIAPMSKPSLRKRKKQKARERSIAKRKVAVAERQRYVRSYPQFISLDADEADPYFVAHVERAARSIDLRDRSLFSDSESKLYRHIKKYGPDFMKQLIEAMADDPVMQAIWGSKLGSVIFSRIPRDRLLSYIPYNDVQVLFGGHDIFLKFRSLRQQSGRNGIVYYSRRRPSLDIDGVPKVVGFSRHAIERVCERIVPRWENYAALADAFAFFDQCLHFEKCELHNGQLAFTFFAECKDGYLSEQFVNEVLGRQIENGQNFYYRVGYCPAVIEGEFVKATSLLPPGFRGTPEFTAIVQADIPRWEKNSMLQQATTMDLDRVKLEGDFGLIKWFHEAGVPQVVESEAPYYASAL